MKRRSHASCRVLLAMVEFIRKSALFGMGRTWLGRCRELREVASFVVPG